MACLGSRRQSEQSTSPAIKAAECVAGFVTPSIIVHEVVYVGTVLLRPDGSQLLLPYSRLNSQQVVNMDPKLPETASKDWFIDDLEAYENSYTLSDIYRLTSLLSRKDSTGLDFWHDLFQNSGLLLNCCEDKDVRVDVNIWVDDMLRSIVVPDVAHFRRILSDANTSDSPLFLHLSTLE